MQLGGFDAVVEVDGIVQNEYLVQAAEGGKGASCWIPSQEGKVSSIGLERRGSVRGILLNEGFCPTHRLSQFAGETRGRHVQLRLGLPRLTASQLGKATLFDPQMGYMGL